jgi:pimeloyl-ACP methyl ester carboxylesterase
MSTPVVLVPGLGLGPEAYAPTLRHLLARYEIVTLPGYGERAARHADLHTETLATELVGHLRQQSVLVGHSASCQVVVEATLRRPDLVKALILVAPSGDLTASSWRVLAARWGRSALWDSPRNVPTLAKLYGRTGASSMARAMEAARRYDLAAAVVKVTVPTVVIRSKHDRLSPAMWTQELAELAEGEAWTLPKGSHMPVLTNGREVATFIDRAAGVYS